MSLTATQKNIINPFPEDMLREGEEYDFSSIRNRFVLDGIHEAYVSNAVYPKVDQVIEITLEELQSLVGASTSVTAEDLVLSSLDLRAYLSLYPQNGTFSENKIIAQAFLTSQDKLQELAIALEIRGVYKLYSTTSSPISLLAENQDGPNEQASKLVSINPDNSPAYTVLLRKAMGLALTPPINSSDDNSSLYGLTTTDNTVNTFLSNDTGIDIYDWRKNCIPNTDNDKVYYNPVDDNYYYTRRTDITDLHAFDISSFLNPTQEEGMLDNLAGSLASLLAGSTFDYSLAAINAAGTGISEILKFSGKYSEQNISTVYGTRSDFVELIEGGIEELSLDDLGEAIQTITSVNPYKNPNFSFSTYLRPRPGSRWMYVVKIKKSLLDSLSAGSGVVLSYEEFELSPLAKARALVNPEKNKTTFSKTFSVDQIQRYIPFVSLRARNYSYQLEDDNITPSLVNGIDLPSEVSKLNSFMDLLSLCFSYNKKAIRDEDLVELFFTKDYRLDHLCVNGIAFTRGIGNLNYHQDPPAGDEQPRRILDAFSLLSPTTFSMIYNSFEIYQETQIASEDNYAPWMGWFKTYLYPTLNLLPTQVEEINDKSRRNLRIERKKDVFLRVSRLANSGKSAEEIKLLYANRKLDYKIGNTIKNINCDTGQARATKSALQFWQAITGKTKFRSIMRQTILTLRDEVISDEVSRELLKRGVDVQSLGRQGLAATNNHAVVRRQIERQVNEQIFCGLDVLGGFIETSFLDPKDMKPQKKAKRAPKIGAQPKIKMPAPTPTSLFYLKAQVYQKIMEEAILSFLKALIAGIIKDVIEAMLGCGPNQSEDLSDSMKNLAFGFVNVNSYLTDVDIVAVTKSVGLYNITRTTDETTKEDPRYQQVFNLLSDISLMCTPVELQSMLLGDGTNVLYELILETVSNGRISFPTSQFSDVDGNTQRAMSTIDPTVYEKFEFTVENIKELFIALGEAMQNAELDAITEFAFSPFAAYCDSKDANLAPLTLRLSLEQLEAQFSAQSNDKIKKINALCDWLRSLENIKQQLIDFINSLGIMEFYDKLLQLIADISNYIADSLSEAWDALFGQETTNTQDPEFTMYMTQMGRDLFYQIYGTISTSLPTAMSPNLQIHGPTSGSSNISEIVYTVPQGWSRDSGKVSTTLVKRHIPGLTDVPGGTLTTNQSIAVAAALVAGGPAAAAALTANYITENTLEATLLNQNDLQQLVIGGYNIRTRSTNDDYLRSSLALPFSPPRSEPWLFGWIGGNERDYPTIQHRMGAYALRTAPSNLRGRLVSISREGTDDEEEMEAYYLKLGELTESWNNDSTAAILSNPSPIHLSVRSISDGGVRIYRAPRTDGVTPVMTEENTLAQFIPDPRDHEPDQDTLTYYGLLTGIDTDTERTLRLGLFSDSPPMPTRIQVSDIISNTLRGYIESTIPDQENWKLNGSFNRLWAAQQNEEVYNAAGKDFINRNEEEWRSVSEIIKEDSINSLAVSNSREFIDRNINQGYTADSGRRKLPQWMKSLNRQLFTTNPDICVTHQEAYIAQATISSLQARMQGFMLNVLPLSRSYPHWGSFGTTVLVADYLTRKFMPQLEDRQLLNLIFENFGILKKVYGDLPSNSLTIDLSIDPRENLKNILQGMFVRILKQSSEFVGNSVDKSLYANHTTNKRYRRMLSRFFHKMSIEIKRGATSESPHITNMTTGAGSDFKFEEFAHRTFGLTTAAERQRTTNFIENELMLRDSNGKPLENVTDLGMLYGTYYFPAPFLIATYLIYYDSEVDISGRFSSAYYRTEVEIATADDGLISAITGQQVFKFQQAFVSFPQDEITWNNLQVTYFSSNQVRSRIEVLNKSLFRDPELLNDWLRLQTTVTEEEAMDVQGNIPGYRADLIAGFIQDRAGDGLGNRNRDDRVGSYPRDFLRATLDPEGPLPSLVEVFGSTTALWSASPQTFSLTFDNVPAYKEWFDAAIESGDYPGLSADRRIGPRNAYEFTATFGNLSSRAGIDVPFSYIDQANSDWNDLIARIFFVFAGYRFQQTLSAAIGRAGQPYRDSADIRNEVNGAATNWLQSLFLEPDQNIDPRNLREIPTERRAVDAFSLIRSERSRLERLLIS